MTWLNLRSASRMAILLGLFMTLTCHGNYSYAALQNYPAPGLWSSAHVRTHAITSADWGAVADSTCRYMNSPPIQSGITYTSYRASSPIPTLPIQGDNIQMQCHIIGDGVTVVVGGDGWQIATLLVYDTGQCTHDPHASYTGGQCVCHAGYVVNEAKNKCEEGIYTLALTPDNATIEPGKQFLFTAMVLDQYFKLPSKSVPVSIEVEVDPKSGGHDHGDSSRPKGSVSPDSGNNIFGVEFKSTDTSGTYTITATCDQCVNKTATAVVTVKVDGLEQIPDSEFYSFIGKKDFHANNHFLRPAAIERLLLMAINYQSQDRFKVLDWRTNAMVYPPVLHVNDASLKWGGRFDIKADWTNPHITHMRGIEVDIRANEAEGAIPPENFEEFDKLLEQSITSKNARRKKFLRECSANALSTSENPNPIQHNRKPENYCVSEVDGSFDNNRHYHVRLLGD